MSLLDRADSFEPATVYPEVEYADDDGNTITKASTTGTVVSARFQAQGQSGTASRRAEEQSEGFLSEQVYEMRLARRFDQQLGDLGAQSQVEWRGKRWSIFGDPARHNGSGRTRRNLYHIVRR